MILFLLFLIIRKLFRSHKNNTVIIILAYPYLHFCVDIILGEVVRLYCDIKSRSVYNSCDSLTRIYVVACSYVRE